MPFTGHVRKRNTKSGITTYQIIVEKESDQKTGKRERYYKTIKGSKKDAERAMRSFITELENKTFTKESKITVAEFMHQWLDLYIKNQLSPTTVQHYIDQTEKYIIPEFGNLYLQQMRNIDIQKWVFSLQEASPLTGKPLSPKTIKNIVLNLSAAMKKAVMLELIPKNPCDNLTLPKLQRFEPDVYSMEEVEQLCTQIAIMDKGRKIAEGTKDELKRMIKNTETVTIEILELPDAVRSEIEKLPHVYETAYIDDKFTVRCSGGRHNLIRILDVLRQNDLSFGRVYTELPTLNDVFLEITGKSLTEGERELLAETARYWLSRFTWEPGEQRYSSFFVKGPDAYCGAAVNNTYTNYMARYNVRLALDLAGDKLDETEREELKFFADHIALLYDESLSLFRQDELFDRLEPLPGSHAGGEPLYKRICFDRMQRYTVSIWRE